MTEVDAKIIDIDVQDIRFPTSLWGTGSDSMVLLNNSHNVTVVINILKKDVYTK